VVDRRCDAGPNASPVHELHTAVQVFADGVHLGESQAVRQMLGHTKLPDFVGGFGKRQYRPEAAGATTAS
jgi:hypothetical protein